MDNSKLKIKMHRMSRYTNPEFKVFLQALALPIQGFYGNFSNKPHADNYK